MSSEVGEMHVSTRESAGRTPQTADPVLVLMGVSGSGKSTVAGIIAGAMAGTCRRETPCTHPRMSRRWRRGSR